MHANIIVAFQDQSKSIIKSIYKESAESHLHTVRIIVQVESTFMSFTER